MDIQIKKWGNSIGLRIPYKIAEAIGIDENSIVEIEANGETLTLKKKPEQVPFSLTIDDLLASIPEGFQYPEDVADFVGSDAAGREQL